MLRLLLMLMERFGPSEPQRADADELRETDRQLLEDFIASISPKDSGDPDP